MSKMDALRAMREANYKDVEARAGKPTAAPGKPKPLAKSSAKASAKQAGVEKHGADPEPDAEKLCGHRAISGRTCTREAGHAAKNHRYS